MARSRRVDGRRDRERDLRVLRISDGDLEVVERDTPIPAADQVVVEVAGAGINRADLIQRAGGYRGPPGAPPDVAGLEFAGTVAGVGHQVRSLVVGDRVFGILGGGGHATHVLTTEWLCARVPPALDLRHAGGIPEVFLTAHDALIVQANLRPGERVLIHGVGSGVGSAAVQLARAVGAETVGTSRTPDKLERARALGLDHGVVAGDEMLTQIGEVDVVLDLLGGRYVETDVAACRSGGRILVVGLLAGSSAELDLGRLLRERIGITGTVLRTRPDSEKAAATAAFEREVVPLLERGILRPVVDRVMPLEEGTAAYDLVGSNATFGKVILVPGG
ncbi:MAG: NAD(P)H-quinone oxidoreductase [Actinomycetota bacterium]